MDNDHESTNKKLNELKQWTIDHEKSDNIRFTQIDTALKDIPKKDEMEDLVRKAMGEVLLSTGKWTKMSIITIALIIGSLVTIFGGFKTLLAWLGFIVTRQ